MQTAHQTAWFESVSALALWGARLCLEGQTHKGVKWI
jgi:hypothetical protein